MTNVIYERWPYYSFDRIEGLRRKTAPRERGILEPKYCQLLQRLCATNDAKNIFQIGTDNGWESMYLASNDSKSRVSVEGKLSNDAMKRIRLLGFHNICENSHPMDGIDMLVNLNGAVQKTFNQYADWMADGGIMVFSRIHEAEGEWNNIRMDSRVKVSMDFFKLGVCWFRSEMQKEHYVVKF